MINPMPQPVQAKPKINAQEFNMAQDRQKRNLELIKEGTIVNKLIKDDGGKFCPDIYIPQEVSLPKDLVEPNREKISKNLWENPMLGLTLAPLSILGIAALISKGSYRACKESIGKLSMSNLPTLARNMNLTKEEHFVTYVALQNPCKKTILGAMGVFVFSSAVFVMKNFTDGFKEIWVKKQDADIQRDLQEKLIDVETRSFAGKNKIINYLLSKIEKDLNQTANSNISFKGSMQNSEAKTKHNNNNALYLAGGIGTLLSCLLLSKYTFKNMSKISKEIDKVSAHRMKELEGILSDENKKNLKSDDLVEIFTFLRLSPEKINEKLNKTEFLEKEKNDILAKVEKNLSKFQDPPITIGGYPNFKITFWAYIQDLSGHFYNMLIDGTPVTRNLFLALASVSGAGYLGSKYVEAVKDVQVKKANAQTEYELHDRLVEVEIKNFLKKKLSSVNPMVEEYKKYALEHPDDREELKKRYGTVLNEIKNGPPFVYN